MIDTGTAGNSEFGVEDEPEYARSFVERPIDDQYSANSETPADSTIQSDDSLSNTDFYGFECATSPYSSVDLEFSLNYNFCVEVRIQFI